MGVEEGPLLKASLLMPGDARLRLYERGFEAGDCVVFLPTTCLEDFDFRGREGLPLGIFESFVGAF